ncbi:unnamed protein product [Rotaria sp. Silwood1]|nr:unnamed protein product [Rotaria sp. Silwood1]
MCSIQNKENLMRETIQCNTNDKIRLLNDLIDQTANLDQLIEYHKKRYLIYYEEDRYKDALHDIETLDQYGYIDETLLMIKCSVFLYSCIRD